MNWVAPIVEEICVGMEVTSYESADISRRVLRLRHSNVSWNEDGSWKTIILGSAAGGGVPQWNCRCHICELGSRSGDPRVHAAYPVEHFRLSADGENIGFVINASPDIRQQIADNYRGVASPRPWRPATRRSRPCCSRTAMSIMSRGFLTLRESQPFDLYATTTTRRKSLDANRIFSVASIRSLVPSACAVDARRSPSSRFPAFSVEMFAVPGKVPLWLEDETMDIGEATETTVGLDISRRRPASPLHSRLRRDHGRRETSCGASRAPTRCFFDGTLWTDAEMIEAGRRA